METAGFSCEYTDKDPDITFESSHINWIYSIISGKYEKDIPKDKFGVIVANSMAFRYNTLACTPVVSANACLIKTKMKALYGYNPEPTLPFGKEMAICLTHDVDNPFMWKRYPSVEAIKSIHGLTRKTRTKLLLRYKFGKFIRKDPNYCFSDWIDYEKSIGSKSAFYFASVNEFSPSGEYEDVKYDIHDTQIEDAIKFVDRSGWEVGLHASINALKRHTLREEKTELEVAGNIFDKIHGVRHHYWATYGDETFVPHTRAGFKYDSSLGLNDMVAFRRGVCHPYTPPTSSILEIPPTAMDAATTSKKELDYHLDVIHRCNGVAVLDWHLEQWNKRNLAGVGEILLQSLETTIEKHDGKIWFCTPKELYDWWILRRLRIYDI